MTEKEIGRYIVLFYNCNKKRMIVRNYSKEEMYAFEVIKTFFKNEKKYTGKNFTKVYYNNKNDYIAGDKWLHILLTSESLYHYFRTIRSEYAYCNRKLLAKNLNYNIMFWYYSNSKNQKDIIFSVSENIYSSQLRVELNALKEQINNKQWTNYFFNLQKEMNTHLFNFLNWNKDNFNFNKYVDLLNSKIESEFIFLQLIDLITVINNHRNALVKVTSGSGEINKKIRQQWDNSSDLEKNIICWSLYWKLLEIIKILQELKN